MQLRVTVGTNEHALRRFLMRFRGAAVGERAQVNFKALGCRVDVMERECCVIRAISAYLAAPTALAQEQELSCAAASLLRDVALMAMVRVRVLAGARTESRLPSHQTCAANHT